jgi:hypothetical protein
MIRKVDVGNDEREAQLLADRMKQTVERHKAAKKHPHLYGENDSLMDLARRAKCAVNNGITDELTGFMAVFHPEVDMTTPEMRQARAENRRGG